MSEKNKTAMKVQTSSIYTHTKGKQKGTPLSIYSVEAEVTPL